LTVCADKTDNFAEEFSKLSPEDVMSDNGRTIITRTQLTQFQHDDQSLSKLFDLAKTEHKDTPVTFYKVRNDVGYLYDAPEIEYHQ